MADDSAHPVVPARRADRCHLRIRRRLRICGLEHRAGRLDHPREHSMGDRRTTDSIRRHRTAAACRPPVRGPDRPHRARPRHQPLPPGSLPSARRNRHIPNTVATEPDSSASCKVQTLAEGGPAQGKRPRRARMPRRLPHSLLRSVPGTPPSQRSEPALLEQERRPPMADTAHQASKVTASPLEAADEFVAAAGTWLISEFLGRRVENHLVPCQPMLASLLSPQIRR